MEENKNKDFTLDDRGKFTEEDAKKALEDLKEYASGKASVDSKATENQKWWMLRHWANQKNQENQDVGSGWLVNSLINKHADIMDSFPAPNILPREADDEEEAKNLTSVVPLVLEHNDYEQVYRDMGWDICIDGAAITGVFWDGSKNEGLGDISITNVDVHNLFWKPGIKDIQASDKVFHVTLEDIDLLKKKWPKLADKIGPDESGTVTKYIHDDNIDTTNCSEVVEMYYKKSVLESVYLDGVDDKGNPTQIHVHDVPRTVLHYAVIISGEIAFCSENEAGYENGFYEHGKFPFVFRRIFPIKDSPWGFGYLDIMKNPQKDIDKLDQAIIKNAMAKAKPRFWAKKNAAIDVDKFADWDNEIIEVGSGDLGADIRQIDIYDVPAGAMNYHASKIDELKEVSNNRDFNQGGISGGVNAASAIAALQEAGSKTSRDLNKELYRGCREEYYLVIELIRQFYTEPREFRVDNNFGGYEFLRFSNANIVGSDVPILASDGMTQIGIRHRRPIFDITVTAEKQSPFSRAAQNETIKELYGMGMFQPENAMPALITIDAMDFEGKDKIKAQIENNATILQQYQAAMNIIMMLAAQNDQIAAMAMQAGLTSPEEMAAMQTDRLQMSQQRQGPSNETPEIRASKATNKGEASQAAKARVRAANMANVR